MKFHTLWGVLALSLAMANAHAQLYKWVAADGTVSYSDTPPPPTASNVERKEYGNRESLADLPYELATVVKGNPVTLYTMANCPACDSGRKTLNERGIPFAEKTVASNEDIERVRQISGASQLPLLVVGRSKLTGFESGQWGNALTAAGYPTSNKLPKTYSNPPPEPAVPPAKAAADPSSAGSAKTPAEPQQGGLVLPPPATGNAPPDFRF